MNADLFEQSVRHRDMLDRIEVDMNPNDRRKRSIFIDEYFRNYDHPKMPPCWMVFELMSFGAISALLGNLKITHRKAVSKKFCVPEPIFLSWCHSLSYLRNLCAHHARVWNRSFTIKPQVAKAYADDLDPNTKIYAQLVTMRILLKCISPMSTWHQGIASLFTDHPRMTPDRVGFKPNWCERPVWR